ncbi:MAG TPA: RHS repeat-associated core domain-containing protein, partial [Vicinamibacterales bacterium]
LTTTDATGRTTTNAYDIVGNLTSSTDSGGQTTTYEFDRRNLLTRTVFPGGASQRNVYDQARQLTSTFDEDNAETRLAYDLGGRITQVTDPLNQSWSFSYDELSNRVSQTDPLGRITRFEYDGLRRETRRTLPGGVSQRRQYDPAGNLSARIDYGGAATTYTYDANNLLLRRTHPDGSFVTFTYDATGQRLTATDSRGVTSYSYDTRNRLTQVTQPDGTSLQYAYDPASYLASRTANVGGSSLTQAFTYDDAGRLATVTDSQARTFTYSYNAAGKVSSLAQPNGVTTAYGYGAVHRLTSLAASLGGTTLQSFAYTLSPAGRRTRIDELGGIARQYTYDAAGRLASETVTGPGGPVLADSFVYDAVGNRTSRNRSIGGGAVATTLYTYDDRDRLLIEGGVTNTWDVNGRLTSTSDGTTHVWDSEGRLLMTSLAAGGSVTNDYDADGNRVRTTNFPAGGAVEVTNFLVDARRGLSHVIVEYAPGNVVKAEYVRGGDQLLSVSRPGGTRFYHADGLGSIRLLTDETGAVTDTYTFDAFGALTGRTGSDPNPYLFTGEPLSPISGLYHLRARWMNPAGGGFLSIDPVDGVIEQPRTLNRYHYAVNDPVNYVDPTGEFGFSIGSISINITISANIRSISVTGGAATLNALRGQLSQLGVYSVRALQAMRTAGQQTHHLIEQRLWRANPALQKIWQHVDDMPGVNLTPAQHQVFTNAWRAAFPYSNQAGHIANPTLQQIMAAADKIYANHPALLRQIYLALL